MSSIIFLLKPCNWRNIHREIFNVVVLSINSVAAYNKYSFIIMEPGYIIE